MADERVERKRVAILATAWPDIAGCWPDGNVHFFTDYLKEI